MKTTPRMATTSPIFDKLYTKAELAAMTTRQRNQYEISLKHYWDMLSDKETTRNRLKRERAEARAQGRAEGEKAKAIAIATTLLAMNYSPTDIARATGLTIDEIMAL